MNNLKLLDLKLVPCPLNVVKINLALEKLNVGEELLVELDKGESEVMVSKNLIEMGYEYKLIHEKKDFIRIKIFNEK